MSIKVGNRIVMAPSGVQKERMKPEDMFVLDLEVRAALRCAARCAPTSRAALYTRKPKGGISQTAQLDL